MNSEIIELQFSEGTDTLESMTKVVIGDKELDVVDRYVCLGYTITT